MIEDEEDDCSILQDNTGATAEVNSLEQRNKEDHTFCCRWNWSHLPSRQLFTATMATTLSSLSLSALYVIGRGCVFLPFLRERQQKNGPLHVSCEQCFGSGFIDSGSGSSILGLIPILIWIKGLGRKLKKKNSAEEKV
jgi:hypothetical protein